MGARLPLSWVTQRGVRGHGRAGPDTGSFPADTWGTGMPGSLPTAETEDCEFVRRDLGEGRALLLPAARAPG